MRSPWTIWVGPESSDKCFYKRYSEKRRREEGHVETEAETGGMLPQAKEYWEPPKSKTRRGRRRDSPLQPPEGARPRQHLEGGLLASRTVRITVMIYHSRHTHK